MALRRVALWLWYRGAGFAGFQAQQGLRTVQGVVLDAVAQAGLPRNPVAAARTDKGVSARMQVLALRIPQEMSLSALELDLAPHWPDDVRLHCTAEAADTFHPAFSATSKHYCYRLPHLEHLEALDAALSLIPGTRDFSVFHFKTSAVQPRTVRRVERTGDVVWFEGISFGRHMVRMLMGGALAVAHGDVSLKAFSRGLTDQQKFHCPVAPADPLVLWQVDYPPGLDPFTAEQRQSKVTGFG